MRRRQPRSSREIRGANSCSASWRLQCHVGGPVIARATGRPYYAGLLGLLAPATLAPRKRQRARLRARMTAMTTKALPTTALLLGVAPTSAQVAPRPLRALPRWPDTALAAS